MDSAHSVVEAVNYQKHWTRGKSTELAECAEKKEGSVRQMDQPNEKKQPNDEMHRREITLQDGRYMIFYTFGDDDSQPDTKTDQREDV